MQDDVDAKWPGVQLARFTFEQSKHADDVQFISTQRRSILIIDQSWTKRWCLIMQFHWDINAQKRSQSRKHHADQFMMMMMNRLFPKELLSLVRWQKGTLKRSFFSLFPSDLMVEQDKSEDLGIVCLAKRDGMRINALSRFVRFDQRWKQQCSIYQKKQSCIREHVKHWKTIDNFDHWWFSLFLSNSIADR